MNYTPHSDTLKGLSEEEAKKRLLSEGFNELPSSKPKNILTIALGVVKEPMFLLLVTCSALYMLLGDIGEGLMPPYSPPPISRQMSRC